jgi:hypothetical protein
MVWAVRGNAVTVALYRLLGTLPRSPTAVEDDPFSGLAPAAGSGHGSQAAIILSASRSMATFWPMRRSVEPTAA